MRMSTSGPQKASLGRMAEPGESAVAMESQRGPLSREDASWWCREQQGEGGGGAETPSQPPGPGGRGWCAQARGHRGSRPPGAGNGRRMSTSLPCVGEPSTAEGPPWCRREIAWGHN